MDKWGWSEYHIFPSNFFLSRNAEKLRRGTNLCCISENFRWRKRLWMRVVGESIMFFSALILMSRRAEKIRKESFFVCSFSALENSLG